MGAGEGKGRGKEREGRKEIGGKKRKVETSRLSIPGYAPVVRS